MLSHVFPSGCLQSQENFGKQSSHLSLGTLEQSHSVALDSSLIAKGMHK